MPTVLERLRSKALRLLRSQYAHKTLHEQRHFAGNENIHALPDIFHYWSNKYLRPEQERFGFSSPDEFFFKYAKRQCQQCEGRITQMVSLGSGNCDLEADLARKLLDAGHSNFVIECVDFNATMLQRGRQNAESLGVQAHLVPQKGDFNRWRPKHKMDVVIASQALHHVSKLEDLFSTIKRQLLPNGVFLTSDMIGRNGHLRWPEARAALLPFWNELPPSYRYNHVLQRQLTDFVEEDCSLHSFEGIRAQDILPLLVEHFQFELFLPFANIVLVFIDRPYGPNFDASADWDRDFIDRLHARDMAGILSGELKPTQMLAVLRNEAVETQLVDSRLTPEFCIRPPFR